MSHLHKRFTSDQVKELLERYLKKEVERSKTSGGTLMKIMTFQKKSNVGNDTLFTSCLLLREFFV